MSWYHMVGNMIHDTKKPPSGWRWLGVWWRMPGHQGEKLGSLICEGLKVLLVFEVFEPKVGEGGK